MVQKKSKTAPQNDLRHMEIESVFSNTTPSKVNISQKELESRVNQIHSVFEGSWPKADIRRALEENEYNVEEVITLRFEGRDQWTEVKKKPTPQQIRISKPKSSEDRNDKNSGAPSRGGRGGGRGGRGGGRGGERGGFGRQQQRTTTDDKSTFESNTNAVDFFASDDATTQSNNSAEVAPSSFFESSTESAFFESSEDNSNNSKPSASSAVSSSETTRSSASAAAVPKKKRPVVLDKQQSQPVQNEMPMSYSQAAAITAQTQKPLQPVQEEKPKKQKKPKQPKQKPAVSQSSPQQSQQQQQQQKTVEQQPVQQQQQESVVQQQRKQQEEKKVPSSAATVTTSNKQAEVILPASQYQMRDINVKFGSLDLNDEPEEEIKPQEPSAPQITASTGRRQSSQQQQPEVQQPVQQQQDYGYANSGWGEEHVNYHYPDTVNQQFHDQSHFFNYPQHPQQIQQQQQAQESGKTTGDKSDPNAQNVHKQPFTGYPMHPYGTPHMQGYPPSYPYGGYPHPYMLPNQYAQQQYGYGPTQSYPKFGYKGVYGGYGSTSPTYGNTTPPADEKGTQQQQQQQQQQHHYGMMHQPQFYMMHHQQYLHDPSSATTATDKTDLGSNRSPQNVDVEQQGATFYPYHMPYNQYVYTGHPHSNLFAPPHHQNTPANPSNTQQRGSSGDSWSN